MSFIHFHMYEYMAFISYVQMIISTHSTYISM